MSIYSYDHQILARSRDVIRQSLELLRWSEAYVGMPRNIHIGECVEPKNGAQPTDAADHERSSDESGSGHRGGESSSS
jgi:hypothetical protein